MLVSTIQRKTLCLPFKTSCSLLKILIKPLHTPDKLLCMSHLLQSIVHLKSNYAVDILKHHKNLPSSDCHRDIGPSHTVHDHYNPWTHSQVHGHTQWWTHFLRKWTLRWKEQETTVSEELSPVLAIKIILIHFNLLLPSLCNLFCQDFQGEQFKWYYDQVFTPWFFECIT